VRLRDIAASLGITERSAFGIITDLVKAGYVVKEKDGAATGITSRRTCRWRSPPAASAPSASPGSWSASRPGR
jgi:hypothetical protein